MVTTAPPTTQPHHSPQPPSLLTDFDLYLFNEGTHVRVFQKLGAHPAVAPDGTRGTLFAVWAPNAEAVSVIGDFNHWDWQANPLQNRDSSGIWEGSVSNIGQGTLYKYSIKPRTSWQ